MSFQIKFRILRNQISFYFQTNSLFANKMSFVGKRVQYFIFEKSSILYAPLITHIIIWSVNVYQILYF